MRERAVPIQLELDVFELEALEGLAERERTSLAEALATAAVYFVAEAATGRTATRIPPFARRLRGGVARECVLSIDEPTLTALVEEAERQAVALERLLTHAALLYTADQSSGRVAKRILAQTGESAA